MTGRDAPTATRSRLRRWVAFATLLGLYFSLRGYKSFEGDQAYRFRSSSTRRT